MADLFAGAGVAVSTLSFAEWQASRGIIPWLAKHPAPRPTQRVPFNPGGFEAAYWHDRALVLEQLWDDEFQRAAGYRRRLVAAGLPTGDDVPVEPIEVDDLAIAGVFA